MNVIKLALQACWSDNTGKLEILQRTFIKGGMCARRVPPAYREDWVAHKKPQVQLSIFSHYKVRVTGQRFDLLKIEDQKRHLFKSKCIISCL